jgi:hypothetical protein
VTTTAATVTADTAAGAETTTEKRIGGGSRNDVGLGAKQRRRKLTGAAPGTSGDVLLPTSARK